MVAEPKFIPSASHCLIVIRASSPSADPKLQDTAKSLWQYFIAGCSVCPPACTKRFALAAAATSSSMPMPLAPHCFAAPMRNLPTVHREGLDCAVPGGPKQPPEAHHHCTPRRSKCQSWSLRPASGKPPPHTAAHNSIRILTSGALLVLPAFLPVGRLRWGQETCMQPGQ